MSRDWKPRWYIYYPNEKEGVVIPHPGNVKKRVKTYYPGFDVPYSLRARSGVYVEFEDGSAIWFSVIENQDKFNNFLDMVTEEDGFMNFERVVFNFENNSFEKVEHV